MIKMSPVAMLMWFSMLANQVGCKRAGDELPQTTPLQTSKPEGIGVAVAKVESVEGDSKHVKDPLIGVSMSEVTKILGQYPQKYVGDKMLGAPLPPRPLMSTDRSKWPLGIGKIPEGATEQWVYSNVHSRRTRSIFFGADKKVIAIQDEQGDF